MIYVHPSPTYDILSKWMEALREHSLHWFPAANDASVAPYLPSPTMAIDMLCMCRNFSTPTTHLADRLNTSECASVHFFSRWSLDTNISYIKKKHVYVEDSDIVIGGVHAKVFTNTHASDIVMAFRHQEGESFFDSDMWEAMGLWGRNFMQLQFPHWLLYGSLTDYLCRFAQSLIFSTRHTFEVDYLPLALQLVHDVRRKYPNATFKFTGYSMGGALAQLVALHFQAPAFTFAANGIVDIIARYHLHPDAPKTVNFIDVDDAVPKMDCQVGTVVEYLNPGQVDVDPHLNFVYGEGAWKMIDAPWTRIDVGRQWSKKHGHCIDNAAGVANVVDTFAEITMLQVLTTVFLGGFLFYWQLQRFRRPQSK
jgi:hypothetical protein